MASVKILKMTGHRHSQNPVMMRCGPHCRADEIDGQVLQNEFHQMFRKLPEKKKSKKKTNLKGKEKKRKTESVERQTTPFLEIRSNPSSFAIFACVRQCVLEKQVREATQLYLRTSVGRIASDTDSDEEELEKVKETIAKVPKVVGIGLCSVFELIKESRKRHPSLCTRALQALLDMLQGQQPEGLKNEPLEVIDALFDLLLEIACSVPAAATESSASSSTLLTSYAAACLLSLVVARGHTGKMLCAAAAMLMSPRSHLSEEIPTPAIVSSLQRSVHAVLLGKTVRPDWLTHGIPKSSFCDSFSLQIPKSKSVANMSAVSDGRYLYLLCGGCMYKVGTGFGGTLKGQIVSSRGGFQDSEGSWLGYAKGFLYLHLNSGHGDDLVKIDRETLREKEFVQLDVADWGPSAYFSDGEHLGLITSGKDDSFLVRTFKTSVSPMPCIHELALKLARKSLEAFGSGSFDDESTFHTISFPLSDDEPISLSCGKDFSLVRTASGKMLVSGKPQSLGVKQGPRLGKWTEVPVTKSPKIVQFSVGHEGLHALLVSEDGSVFFTGLARRGEDGDQTKGRRQPKPVKPKKMIKLEGQRIVSSACNNGTSALVTQEGELYLFGKDAAHADHNTGLVTDLKDAIIVQVALGKAHVVALSNKGQVYTFGINHKGQCGREFSHGPANKEGIHPVAMATAPEEEGEEEEGESEEQDLMCPPGKHRWKHDQCMVCTLCGECTGYGAGCIASGRPERNPGQACGCGAGDSGCSDCGCCRTCAKDGDVFADWDPLAAGGLLDNKQSDVIVLDIRYGVQSKAGRAGARLEDRIRRRMEEYRIRQRRKQMLQSLKVIKGQGVSPLRSSAKLQDVQDKGSVASADENFLSDHEKESTKLTSLPPARLFVSCDSPIVQVACGMHHSVLLTANGEVWTFGSNQHGQLGLGDYMLRDTPELVKMPIGVTQVAAGSNHTVLLTSQGQVFTFGSYQRRQLGRPEGGRDSPSWHSLPAPVPQIGPKHGRRATWIGASGDQTFIKMDESLISSHSLSLSSVVAAHNCIGILPKSRDEISPFKCLLINKVDGTCRSFNTPDQVELNNSATCLDSTYNTIWSFDPLVQRVSRFNIVASEARVLTTSRSETDLHPLPNFFGPEMAVPGSGNVSVGRSHAALHLLGCLDVLTAASEQGLPIRDREEERQNLCKAYGKEDFSVVNRFESHGGGWGYSGHSIEAIRFMADTDVLLGGFGLFGGRGEYTAKLKLFDIGMEGGEQETDGDLVAETEEIPYECGARQKYSMLFEEPVPLQANRWYVGWARISGPSSDCGSSGQSVVTTEDQVVFYFKSSKKSNNGTDVNAGQIPQLLYRAVMPDSHLSTQPSCLPEQVCVLSRDFSCCVSPECFHSLLKLLRWSWQTFKAALCEAAVEPPPSAALPDLEKLTYICCASLHLLRIYVNEIYPNATKKIIGETQKLAECVGDCCALLRHILSDQVPPTLPRMLRTVTEECHRTFLACYHAFYPSSNLKWRGLCDLLLTVDVPWVKGGPESDHLLAAVLSSLCSPSVRLTSILPVPGDRDPSCDASQLPSPAGPDTPPSAQEMSGTHCLDGQQHRYPLLVEVMTQRSEREGCHAGPCTFREVLDCLLAIVLQPVRALLREDSVCHSIKLVSSTSALLATLVAEIASQTVGTVLDLQGSGCQLVYTTPSRFTRISQNRTWNTGNGSPDAICLSVDRPGILIAGACVYGGTGNEWHFELELLDDSGSNVEPSHTQRWKTLEIVRGTFGPDDCYGDVAEIKFERPVPIKENVKYAIRLRNHGARTNNGDGGLAQVKGPDGTTFTYSDCSLSFNGTNHTRGQVPQILYYSTPQDSELQQNYKDMAEVQARRNALTIGRAIVRAAADLFMEAQAQEDEAVLCAVGCSHLVTVLLPLVLAHMGPLATSDPRSAVQILGMVRDLLPLVAALNERTQMVDLTMDIGTTSTHYAVVESEHPYRPATVCNYKVAFPDSVRWMCLEFDPACGTSQCEDSLQLYIPRAASASEEDGYVPCWPVLRKFGGGADWPHSAVVLPGNQVLFSLETASDYVKDERARSYGFRCQVVGFECMQLGGGGGLLHLERELAYLGGMCAASLMRKDLLLPPASVMEMEEDLDLIEELAQQVYSSHVQLLSKGFAMAHPATIHQALEGVLPFAMQSNERPFLKDFVACTAGTSGGRLARWLQPEPHVDPKQCELLCSQEELKCGWPAVITVITKDQYGKVVTCPSLKVEVKAVPLTAFDKEGSDSGRKLLKTSKLDTGSLTFGGHPPPSLDAPYEITVKDKMFYYAITMMKAYENYSFEELRYVSPTKKRLIENMLVRSNADGTHTANWTPGSVGWYILRATVDGFEMGGSQLRSVEVKEPPQGMLMPSRSSSQKNCLQPGKVRRFQAKYSAGLRIRSHPSLQSEQIGIVQVNGTVSFVDELHNDDGVWLRLSPETVKKYCHNGYVEAWCLQYNQHLGKTLLVPLEEPKSVLSDFFRDASHFVKKRVPSEEQSKSKRGHSDSPVPFPPSWRNAQETVLAGPGVYHVVRCGASGHNVRSRPSLKAPPVGMLVLGNAVGILEDVVNADGIWVRLDADGMRRFCFNGDGEAWSLAQSRSEVTYLQHEAEMMQAGDSDEESVTTDGRRSSSPFAVVKKGYDFGASVCMGQQPSAANFGHSPGLFSFGSDQEGGSSGSASPFVFGSPVSTPSTSMHAIADSEPTTERSDTPGRVASVQRRLRDEVANKKGGSPSECYRSSLSRDVPPELQGVSVRELVKAMGESRFNGNAATPPQTPTSTPPLPRRQAPRCPRSVDGDGKNALRRGSMQSDGSVVMQLNSILKELSQGSATGCIGCMTQSNTISPISTPGTPKKEALSTNTGKSVTQTGTQTSPPESTVKSHFSIGSKEERLRLSPKTSRKERRRLRAGKRADSPHEQKAPPGPAKEQVQEALAPSVAECLRAVFAAFLWHEGIVYDAMACASFLKFNPNLPKDSPRVRRASTAAPVPSGPLTKEEKARLRHSVEVAPGLLNLEQVAPLNANVVKSKKSSEDGERSSPPYPSSDLPQSLRHLVHLWEQISTSCTKAMVRQLILPGPATLAGGRLSQHTGCERRPKRRKDRHKGASLFGEAERETSCELCGQYFSHPVTYHMRQAHPGCGDHAGGKGYNSGGNFCGGWAGNCGDGGIGGSSWYLICDRCREKYLRQKRQNIIRDRARKTRKKCTASVHLPSPLPVTEDAHHVMKNNALFLLELSSATRSSLSSQLAPEGTMPSVVEQEDSAAEANPFPVGPFRCLRSLGCEASHFPCEEDSWALERRGGDSALSGLGSSVRRPRKNGEGSRSFHRSVSVGLTSREWNRQEGEGLTEGRVVMMRKRNSSGSEDGGGSFLCQPSTALTKLVALADERSASAVDFTLQRPVMIFLLQRHDLERLQLAMRQALRKAACRVYGMQALNWLLRSVTQPISLHDLLWCFVAALAPLPAERRTEDDESAIESETVEKKEHEEPDQSVCEHPLVDVTVAGDAVHPLRQTFHALLQTVSDLMTVLPVGSSLQQMAMRCWCLRFMPQDHAFLHGSHVFSNISKILSKSEEENTCPSEDGLDALSAKATSRVECMKDVTLQTEIRASSRQAMVGSLTDGSTETFWESGDEDRNKSKSLLLLCASPVAPWVIYVHIDNCRDLANKVSGIVFKSGASTEELQRLKQVEVENRFTGWIGCFIPESLHSCIRLDLKGPDNTLRLRQVKVLARSGGTTIEGYSTSAEIQQKNCEAETLKVFRLLTSQVFGKLVSGGGGEGEGRDESGAEASNDLKEHVVGILFSGSKLTHLQKQVCTHIVAAIRQEAVRLREEWEALLCSRNAPEVPKSSDAYCFEMLSMVLALSGSGVGRTYLAQQSGLLRDLFSLLHTGSARVQRQVTSLLRRVLPEVPPQVLASILEVAKLPPSDYSIVSSDPSERPFDPHATGILDVFLACIAKALTLQTKVKGGSGSKGIATATLATSIHPRDYVGGRWWLRGCMARKLAQVIVQLLKDMAGGKLTEAWATVTKGAIAENILNLTKMDEHYRRTPAECLRTPTLWLALASLCVLDQDHVERLSSGQWVGCAEGQQAHPRPKCDNHDDDETPAIILCNSCGNLCADCDRFLHLHRRTRSHQRQVFKEEEEAIRVDLHEGCGRTKLFWVMALADSRTLKAMVEFREGTRGKGATSGVCRFCGAMGGMGLLAIGNVCGEPECQEHARNACSRLLSCGHPCGGIRGESPCLPCLQGCCGEGSGLKQDADDMCMICFTESLACAPALQLLCGHVFHLHCCRAVLARRWLGPRITFGFSLCPICKAPMNHPVLKDLLDPVRSLYEDVRRKAQMRLEYEGLLKAEAVTVPGARFYNDPAGFAMERYAYYVCYKCKKAYYGGEARCDAEAGQGEEYDPTELVCGACSDVSRAQMCPKHGTDFLEYKCRYCCSVAVFFCFGTTHFCNACHDDFQRVTNIPKADLPHCPAGPKAKQMEGEECPLHVKHPPTGEEFALGCGVCRNAHTF